MGLKSKLKKAAKKVVPQIKKAVTQPKTFVKDAVQNAKENAKVYGPTYVKAQLVAGATLATLGGASAAAAGLGAIAKSADTYQSVRLRDKMQAQDVGPAMMDDQGYMVDDPGQNALDPTVPQGYYNRRPTNPMTTGPGIFMRAAVGIENKVRGFWGWLTAQPANNSHNSLGAGAGEQQY